jgi:hypothetical protein
MFLKTGGVLNLNSYWYKGLKKPLYSHITVSETTSANI